MAEKAVGQSDAKWWVYIIENKLGHLYTGITTDVSRRFEEHASGSAKGAKALRGKGPLSLKYQSLIGSKSDASKVEYWIKQQSKQRKLHIIESQSALSVSLIGQHTDHNKR